MTIAEAFLGEFEHEAVTTRKFLERIPEDKLTWRPHEKSMTAGQLALHIARFPAGIVNMAREEQTQMPDLKAAMPQPESVSEILSTFDNSVATVREILPTIDDQSMQEMWRALQGETEILAMPRMAVLRNILLNHLYHHRGQLGVYLRLLGAKVPSCYGPSGDELPDFLQDKGAVA